LLPLLVLRARCPAEGWAIAILFVTVVVASARARSAADPLSRSSALFAAYLSLLGAACLGIHALTGRPPLVVSAYALTLVAGVIVCWAMEARRLRSIGFDGRLVFYCLFGCLVFGVAGGRIASTLAELPARGAAVDVAVELTDRARGGLGVFGAFVADALFLAVLFRRFREHSLARMLDASASIIALNVAVGRVGCLLAGCCFGARRGEGLLALPIDAFQPESPAGLAYGAARGGFIWASQPLEAGLVLLIAMACELLFRARVRLALRPGTIIAVAAASYGAVRAVLEGVRADSARPIAGTFTVWQLLAVALSLGSMAWLAFGRRQTASSSGSWATEAGAPGANDGSGSAATLK